MTIQEVIKKAIKGGFKPKDKMFILDMNKKSKYCPRIGFNYNYSDTNGYIALPYDGYERLLFLDPFFLAMFWKSDGMEK